MVISENDYQWGDFIMRQKKLWITMIMLLVLSLLLPAGAMAYSYGDPNKEDVAESFKEIVVELNQNPVDWTKAVAIYKTRRAEISSHFGEAVAHTLDINLADEDKEAFIANYKAVLGMNLERRFTYALKSFDDYADTKLLVAKAKGTYDVIKPYLPSSQTDELDTAFEVAYVALGNPGLFGVGEKPSDEAEFKKQTSFILDTIIPIFPYRGAKAPIEEQPIEKPIEKPVEKPIDQPTKSVEPVPAPTKEPIVEEPPADSTESTPVEEEPVVAETDPVEPIEEEVVLETEDNASTEIATNVDVENAATDNIAAEHAPMERTKKTNPLISIIVIAALIGVIGTALWMLRKRKLI